MRRGLANRRIWAGMALAVVGLLAVAGMALVLVIASQYRAADYPGSMLVADHSMYKFTPSLYFRRDTSYRSSDDMPLIYNWYSQNFSLGAEARAQSACITLERSSEWWLVQQYFGVTLCDTANGRMMFVQRSFMLRSLNRATGASP